MLSDVLPHVARPFRKASKFRRAMRKHTTQKWSFRIAYREIVSILWFLSILVASIDKHNIEKICLYSVLHFPLTKGFIKGL